MEVVFIKELFVLAAILFSAAVLVGILFHKDD